VKILVLRKLISYTEDRVKLVSFSNEPGALYRVKQSASPWQVVCPATLPNFINPTETLTPELLFYFKEPAILFITKFPKPELFRFFSHETNPLPSYQTRQVEIPLAALGD
jgi:hypothetical protein